MQHTRNKWRKLLIGFIFSSAKTINHSHDSFILFTTILQKSKTLVINIGWNLMGVCEKSKWSFKCAIRGGILFVLSLCPPPSPLSVRATFFCVSSLLRESVKNYNKIVFMEKVVQGERGGRLPPPPLIGDMSLKKSIVFLTPSIRGNWCKWIGKINKLSYCWTNVCLYYPNLGPLSIIWPTNTYMFILRWKGVFQHSA